MNNAIVLTFTRPWKRHTT